MSKPFDLEAAKRGEPIEAIDGTPRYFVGVNPKNPVRPVVYACENGSTGECYVDGRLYEVAEPWLRMSTKKRAIEFAVLEYSNRDRPYRVLVPVDEVDAWAGKDTDQRVTVEIEE